MGNNRKSAARREFTARFYQGNRIPFLLASFSTVLIAASNLWLTWLMQQMIDTVSGVPGALALRLLAWLTAVTIGMIVLCKALSYVSLPRFMENAMGQYKEYAFEKLTKKNVASFSQESTAAYLSAFSNDAISVETNYLTNRFTLLTHGIKLAGSLVLMLAYSPILTAAACALFVLPMGAAPAAWEAAGGGGAQGLGQKCAFYGDTEGLPGRLLRGQKLQGGDSHPEPV